MKSSPVLLASARPVPRSTSVFRPIEGAGHIANAVPAHLGMRVRILSAQPPILTNPAMSGLRKKGLEFRGFSHRLPGETRNPIILADEARQSGRGLRSRF